MKNLLIAAVMLIISGTTAFADCGDTIRLAGNAALYTWNDTISGWRYVYTTGNTYVNGVVITSATVDTVTGDSLAKSVRVITGNTTEIIYQAGGAGIPLANSTRKVVERDSKGNITISHQFNWIGGQWVLADYSTTHTYTYDGNNNITSSSVKRYLSGSYIDVSRRDFYYDGGGALTGYRVQEKDNQGAWVTVDSIAYDLTELAGFGHMYVESWTYNPLTLMLEYDVTERVHFAGFMMPANFYNGEEYNALNVADTIDLHFGTPTVVERTIYIRDPDGGSTYIRQALDNGILVTQDSSVTTVDAYCNVTEYLQFQDNAGNMEISYGLQADYQYNATNGAPLEKINKQYDPVDMLFKNYSREVYSDYTIIDNTISTSSPVQALDVKYQAYPNPATDWLTIDLGISESPVRALVMAMDGRVVINQPLHTGQNLMQLHHIPGGVYMLQLFDEQGRYKIDKLLVQ